MYMLIMLKRPALKSNGSSPSEAYSHIECKIVPVHAMKAYEGLIGSAALTLALLGGGRQVVIFMFLSLYYGGKRPRNLFTMLLTGP
jgi:hypothetical protein